MGAVIGTIIGGLIAGIIIGPLARLVMPGKQDMSIPMTIGVGAIGAIIGGFIAQALGVGDTAGIDWIKLTIQIAIAIGAIVAYGAMVGDKT